MADRDLGLTRSKGYRLVSGGAAYTLQLPWQADYMRVINISDWTNTAGNLPIHEWFRDETDAAEVYQMQVIDSAAAQSFNFLNPTTNGFTVADTSGGQSSSQASISAVSQADPCVVTTSAAHGFQDNQIVRITDLGSSMPTARGMDELNNNRYKITITSTTQFSLQDPVSGEDINSINFVAYVSGGFVKLESHVNALNYPQQGDYATTPYVSNPFSYDPVSYRMTLGTEIMGADSDRLVIHVLGFGDYENLGDVG